MKSARQKVVTFLNSIGIRTVRGKVPVTSFLPGIKIQHGVLLYNHKALAADLLHEAAHIAIVPSKYRVLCSGNMDRSMQRIWNAAQVAGEIEIDAPIFRQVIQASESEAIAWSWAAGRHPDLPDEEIITNAPATSTVKGRKYEHD
jgi:hypothetical protein